MTTDQKKILNFIKEADKLKTVYRKIYITGGRRRESSAEHTYHLALMVWVFKEHFEQKVNLEKAFKMALLHDLVEIYNGDIFFYHHKKRTNKHEDEKKAAKKLFKLLPPKLKKEFMDLWLEYEYLKTPESKFVQAMDKIHPMIQNIMTEGKTWKQFKVTLEMIYPIKIKYMESSKFLISFFKHLLGDIKKRKIAHLK